MNMLASLKTEETSKLAEEKDSLGGGRKVFDSGAYPAKIGMAYVAKSDGGALGLFLTFAVGEGEAEEEFRSTLWMTSGDAKGNKPYYVDKDGNNQPLPGFNMAKSLALLSTGQDIADLPTEEKVIKLYNSDAKAEVPTKVQAVTELIGKPIVIGIIKQTNDVTKKGADGKYAATGETREENEIEKFFCGRDDHMNKTTTEIKSGSPAEFYGEWVKKFAGTVRNKAKGAAAGGTAGAPGAAPGAAAGTPKPKSSLFGN